MKKIFSLFLAALMCAVPAFPSFAKTKDIDISAGAAVVADLNTGTVLYTKNSDAKLYPASLTKVMTAMIALDNSNLTDTITVSENAVTSMQQNSILRMNVIAGQQITMKEALHAMLMCSSNDITVAIAEHISGSVEEFTALMNQYAKNLGCTQTVFANPTGLDAENVSTSALDMAVICKKAAENSSLLKICGSKIFTFESEIMDTQKKPLEDDYILTNQHKMISGEFPYEYAYAGKTGYTDAAQTTLATYAKKDELNLIAVILNSPNEEDAAYEDTKLLLDYCFDNYDTLVKDSTQTLNLTDQNQLLSDQSKHPETKESETKTKDTASDSSIINAIKGHSWQDYAIIGSIVFAALLFIILLLRQTVIYMKRRRRRKNYIRLKEKRLKDRQSQERKESVD